MNCYLINGGHIYAMPAFIVNLAIYLVFLAFLTAFVVVLPIPGEGICNEGRKCDEGMEY